MSDCYEWIDPFAEIARQRRRADASYEEGRRSVLKMLSGQAGELIGHAIRMHSDRLGEKIAREAVVDAARAIQTHMQPAVTFSALPDSMEEMVVTSVEMRPFRHHVASRLALWR